jgi:hypothetical protein
MQIVEFFKAPNLSKLQITAIKWIRRIRTNWSAKVGIKFTIGNRIKKAYLPNV